MNPIDVMATRDEIILTRHGQEKLANHLCDCPYLLPAQNALDPNDHRTNCPYRATMEKIERNGLAAVLAERTDHR